MIRVSNDYVIDVDEMNYVVKRDEHRERYDSKSKKHYQSYDPIAYFRTLEQAIYYLAERDAAAEISKGEVGLSDAVRIIDRAHQRIAEAVHGAIPHGIKKMR